jgi:GAF domain-containing protein
LLPRSQAPGIELLRHRIEEQLKEAVLQQPDLELLYRLAQQIPDDLTLWEALLHRLPAQDPRHPAVRAWVRRLSAQYR